MSWFAVVIACVAQGALSHQHLVFFAPREWDKVRLFEYKIDRHDATGYNPNKEGWVTAATTADMTTFAYSFTVQVHDKVSVKVTTMEGDTTEDTLHIDDVRTEGNKGKTHSWKVGPLPLFSLLENVRHADVWKTFVSKLRDLPTGDVQEQMGRLFADAEKEHEGWHLVMLMDHVPYSNVELSYTTTAGKTRKTSKNVDGGGVFAAWSLDDVAGDLELFFDGESKVNMQILTASFQKSSFASSPGESHVYILPFNSHKHSDAAWREVMKHHASQPDAHQFWDDQSASWKGGELQKLTEDLAAGRVTAALPADTLALEQDDEFAEEPAASSGLAKMAIAVAVVAVVLLVGGYYFCCTTPEEDERGCSIDSTTLSNDPPQAPSMLGDAWPQESVHELVPPAAVV